MENLGLVGVLPKQLLKLSPGYEQTLKGEYQIFLLVQAPSLSDLSLYPITVMQAGFLD